MQVLRVSGNMLEGVKYGTRLGGGIPYLVVSLWTGTR